MAYMSQDNKKKIKSLLDPIMKQYGIKYSLGVHNGSTLVCNIRSSAIDFIGNYKETMQNHVSPRMQEDANSVKTYMDINPYWCHEHFTGVALEAVMKIKEAMMTGNFDKSDSQSDYFHVGWYIDINIGNWNKPYQLIKQEMAA